MNDHAVQHASFTLERRYKAAPARVFAAFADPAAKRAWFAEGEGWRIHRYDLDFREGGVESSAFSFGESSQVIRNETIFHDIVADRRIVYSYWMDRDGVRFSVSLATIELAPDGPGALLRLTEQVAFFEGGDGPTLREDGTRELLEKLGAYLND